MNSLAQCGGLLISMMCVEWIGVLDAWPGDTHMKLQKAEVTEYRLKEDVIQKVDRDPAALGLVHRMESYCEPGKFSRWLATNHVTIVEDRDRHFAFGGAAQLKNGDLVVVYREGTKHEVEPIGKICLSRSKDRGRTWLPRVTVLDQPGVDERQGSIFQMSDGTVLLFSGSGMRTSSDLGETWSEIRPTNIISPSGGVEDEEGHIVYAGQATIQKQFALIDGEPADLLACVLERSKDRGLSWERVGVGTYTLYVKRKVETSVLWQREPSFCVVPDRFYVMCTCCRMVGDGFIRVIRSADRGKTWGPLMKTPVWGKPAHLLALKDGRLLMSYGYRRPPYGVRACLSNDHGLTWDVDNEIIIRMDGGTPPGQNGKVGSSDLGYPQSIQLNDGLIFTVYYFNKNGSNAYMAGTFWELPAR